MSELLPCPWCGETPRSTNTNAGWDVVCGNTDCPVEPEAVAFSQAAAEAAWNTRTPPATPGSKPTGEDYAKAIATIENSLTHTTHSYWEAAKYILRTAEAIARQRAGGGE